MPALSDTTPPSMAPATPPIPTVDAFVSAPLTYRPGDLMNPPALANFWGACQAALDPTAIEHLTFPPYSYGDIPLGGLVIDGQGVGKCGAPVTFRWRPDRIDREAVWEGLRIQSTVVLPLRSQRVVLRVEVTNTTATARRHEVRLRTSGGVVRAASGWTTPYSPKEGPSISVTPWEGTPPPEYRNRREALDDLGALIYTSETSEAVAVHLTAPQADRIDGGDFVWMLDLAPGETATLHYALEIGTDRAALIEGLRRWRDAPDAPFACGGSRLEHRTPGRLHARQRPLQRLPAPARRERGPPAHLPRGGSRRALPPPRAPRGGLRPDVHDAHAALLGDDQLHQRLVAQRLPSSLCSTPPACANTSSAGWSATSTATSARST